MPTANSGRALAAPAPGHVLLMTGLVVACGFAISQGVTNASLRFAMLALAGAVLFVVASVRADLAIYLLIFSMLLSPEIGLASGPAHRDAVRFRSEDFMFLIIGFSWFAKTPLNRPILATSSRRWWRCSSGT